MMSARAPSSITMTMTGTATIPLRTRLASITRRTDYDAWFRGGPGADLHDPWRMKLSRIESDWIAIRLLYLASTPQKGREFVAAAAALDHGHALRRTRRAGFCLLGARE